MALPRHGGNAASPGNGVASEYKKHGTRIIARPVKSIKGDHKLPLGKVFLGMNETRHPKRNSQVLDGKKKKAALGNS